MQDDHHEAEGLRSPEDAAAGARDDRRAAAGHAPELVEHHGRDAAAADDE